MLWAMTPPRTLALALALIAAASAQTALAQTAPAQDTPVQATPVFVQPPQQQTPAVTPSVAQVAVTPAPQPAPDRFTVWGGASTEFYVLPGVMVGASAPVGRVGNLNLALRASAEAILVPLADAPGPLPIVNADLLLSGGGRGLRVYGGPSVGTVLGYAWLLGGVAGVRGDFGTGPWGYFAEAKARVGYVAGGDGGAALVLPGGNLGVTYRF